MCDEFGPQVGAYMFTTKIDGRLYPDRSFQNPFVAAPFGFVGVHAMGKQPIPHRFAPFLTMFVILKFEVFRPFASNGEYERLLLAGCLIIVCSTFQQ